MAQLDGSSSVSLMRLQSDCWLRLQSLEGYFQDGAYSDVCWQKASLFCHMRPSIRLSECPHDVTADFPQSK